MIYVRAKKTAINAITGRVSYRVVKVRDLGEGLSDVFKQGRRAWATKTQKGCISILCNTRPKLGAFINLAKAVKNG